MEPLPDVKIASSVVSCEESHQKGGFFTQTSIKSQATAFFFSKFNDQKRNKTFGNTSLQSKHCGLKGHVIKRCFKLNGYPKDFKFTNKA